MSVSTVSARRERQLDLNRAANRCRGRPASTPAGSQPGSASVGGTVVAPTESTRRRRGAGRSSCLSSIAARTRTAQSLSAKASRSTAWPPRRRYFAIAASTRRARAIHRIALPEAIGVGERRPRRWPAQLTDPVAAAARDDRIVALRRSSSSGAAFGALSVTSAAIANGITRGRCRSSSTRGAAAVLGRSVPRTVARAARDIPMGIRIEPRQRKMKLSRSKAASDRSAAARIAGSDRRARPINAFRSRADESAERADRFQSPCGSVAASPMRRNSGSTAAASLMRPRARMVRSARCLAAREQRHEHGHRRAIPSAPRAPMTAKARV